jgi:large subunit ribosomal protein L15
MTELHDLRPNPGSHRNRKRVGRGPGSGTGKTSGRGQKGQKARSGASIPAGFEGGQMPLQRRIPKGGFTPLNRVEYQVVNVRTLQEMEASEVTPEILQSRGLIGSGKVKLKILGTGDLERAVQVHAHAFSASAREKIEAAGGSATVIDTDTDA